MLRAPRAGCGRRPPGPACAAASGRPGPVNGARLLPWHSQAWLYVDTLACRCLACAPSAPLSHVDAVRIDAAPVAAGCAEVPSGPRDRTDMTVRLTQRLRLRHRLALGAAAAILAAGA